MIKRFFILLLSAVLLVSSTGCMALHAVSGSAAMQASASKPVPFGKLRFERPDAQAIFDAIAALNARLDKGDTDADSMLADYENILVLFDMMDYEAGLAYLFYAQDVTQHDYETAYTEIVSEEYAIDVELTALSIRLYESPVTGPKMDAAYSASFKEQTYAGRSLNSPEILPLISEEQTLSGRYEELLSTFSFEDGGKTYTYDDLAAIRDDSEYERLVGKYYKKLNLEAGRLFLELAGLRRRIASSLGYGSYTEYAYRAFFRDYTPEDAGALHAAVKKYIVPIYSDAVLSFYMSGGYEIADTLTADKNAFYGNLRKVLAAHVPEALEAFDHMRTNGYYDDGTGKNRLESSFTSYLTGAGSPFLFSEWTGYATEAITLTHELGHFTRRFLVPNRAWSNVESLDLDEIDSQGLELLLSTCYEDLFGDGGAILRLDELISMMYAIISGCLEDEFQQAVYADPEITLEEMNALYYRLASEYGFTELYGFSGTEWCTIPHTFTSPFYYISYAVSMISAAELWRAAEDDPGIAYDVYRNLLVRPLGSDLRETLASFGFSDPFSEDTVRGIAASLKNEF